MWWLIPFSVHILPSASTEFKKAADFRSWGLNQSQPSALFRNFWLVIDSLLSVSLPYSNFHLELSRRHHAMFTFVTSLQTNSTEILPKVSFTMVRFHSSVQVFFSYLVFYEARILGFAQNDNLLDILNHKSLVIMPKFQVIFSWFAEYYLHLKSSNRSLWPWQLNQTLHLQTSFVNHCLLEVIIFSLQDTYFNSRIISMDIPNNIKILIVQTRYWCTYARKKEKGLRRGQLSL